MPLSLMNVEPELQGEARPGTLTLTARTGMVSLPTNRQMAKGSVGYWSQSYCFSTNARAEAEHSIANMQISKTKPYRTPIKRAAMINGRIQ